MRITKFGGERKGELIDVLYTPAVIGDLYRYGHEREKKKPGGGMGGEERKE